MSSLSKLRERFPALDWQSDVVLAPFTYMKVGGPAEIFWRATNREELEEVVHFVRSQMPEMPLTVLGGASNVVIADAGLTGLVILNTCSETRFVGSVDQLHAELRSLIQPATTQQYFLSDSGIKTALLVRATVDSGLTGLEPFLGVPGTLGGAIYNNAHYTHELIGSFVAAVRVVDEQGSRWLPASECAFAYDSSRFQGTKEVITQVLFALQPGTKEQSLEVIREATMKRAATQPLGTANSGCLFKNAELSPEQQQEYDGKETLSAGWLIDQAGLKGKRVGGAVVSSKHANFLVNEGTASARDVESLAREVEKTVREKFGIQLEREVFFLGNWEE